ncbi:MAG: type II toxin-antitoxin system MqsR family toxin [Dongiaceae bacterium]
MKWHHYDAILRELFVMEKRKPHYDLATVQAQFAKPAGYRITVTAQDFAFGVLALDRAGVVSLVGDVRQRHFEKSMTSVADHRIWQDVYNLPYEDMMLYLKFTKDDDGFYLLISLKEK